MAKDRNTKKYAYLRTDKGTVPMVYVPGHWAPAFKLLPKNEDDIEFLDIFKISQRESEQLGESDHCPVSKKTPVIKTRVDNKHYDADDVRDLLETAGYAEPPLNKVHKWLEGHTRRMADINEKPKYNLDAQEKLRYNAQAEPTAYVRPGPSKCCSQSDIDSSVEGDLGARSKARKTGKHAKPARDETRGESHRLGAKHAADTSAYKVKERAESSVCSSRDQREYRHNTSKVTFKEKSIRALSILSGARSSGSSHAGSSVHAAAKGRAAPSARSGGAHLVCGAGASASVHGARARSAKSRQAAPSECRESTRDKRVPRKLPESYGKIPNDGEDVIRSNICYIDLDKYVDLTPSESSDSGSDNGETSHEKKKKDRFKTTSATRMYQKNTPEGLYQSERTIVNKKRYNPQPNKEKHYVCVGEGIKSHAFSLTNTSDYMDMKDMLSDSDLDPNYHVTSKSKEAKPEGKKAEEKASKKQAAKDKAIKSADEGSVKQKRTQGKKSKDKTKKAKSPEPKAPEQEPKKSGLGKKEKPWIEVGPLTDSDITEEIPRPKDPMVGLKIKADMFPPRRGRKSAASGDSGSMQDGFMIYLQQRQKDEERIARQEQILGRPKYLDSVTDLTAKLAEEAAAYESDVGSTWSQKLRAAADAAAAAPRIIEREVPRRRDSSTVSISFELDSPNCGWDAPSEDDKSASASQRGKKKNKKSCTPACHKCKGVQPVKRKVPGPEDEYLVDDTLREKISYGMRKRGQLKV